MSKATACTDTDRLAQMLFGHDNMRLQNIKFCRGYKEFVEPSEIAASVHAALLSIRSGQAVPTSEFPDIPRGPVDVVEYLKSL